MPFDRQVAAHGKARCADAACPGHAVEREVAAEARTRIWLRRVGAGAVTVARTERLPLVLHEHHRDCTVCGKPVELTSPLLTSEPGWRGVPRLDYPQPPRDLSGYPIDEQLPEPPPKLTPEQRLERVEERLERLEQALGAEV